LDRFWNSQEQKFNYSEMIKTTEQDLSKTSIQADRRGRCSHSVRRESVSICELPIKTVLIKTRMSLKWYEPFHFPTQAFLSETRVDSCRYPERQIGTCSQIKHTVQIIPLIYKSRFYDTYMVRVRHDDSDR